LEFLTDCSKDYGINPFHRGRVSEAIDSLSIELVAPFS